MSIYTKTGDKGETSVFGGHRVPKYSSQIEAYGSVDELDSFLGIVISKAGKKDYELLTQIQKDLYEMMNVLCGAKSDITNLNSQVMQFEKLIDKYDKKLPKLNRFILPQGTELAAWFHVVRSICRRAERQVVFLFSQNENTIDQNQQIVIVKYLNRLSDLFFIMARNAGKGREVVT